MASHSQQLQVPDRRYIGNQLALVQDTTQHAMSVTGALLPGRKRASKPKVRTGCTTCKIRRVKCDETKPNCKRCTSTGRKCDGYEFTGRSQANPSQLSLPSSISAAFPGTAKEHRIFERFRAQTIPAFAGSSEVEFWERLVLKVGHQEPVVRNAIVALATLHEDYQQRNGKYSQDLINEPSYQQALSLYGKALRQLNERLNEADKTSAKLAFIASILFTCFEVLRRNSMAAIIHYQAGMRELTRQIKTSRQDNASSASSQFSSSITEFRPIPQDELDVLLRVFANYDMQACTYAKPRVEALAISLSALPPPSMTLDQVKTHLNDLLLSVYQLIKSDLSMYRYWKTADVPADWLLRRDQAITTFEAWINAFESFFGTAPVTVRPCEMKALLGLRMEVKVAIISLKTCIDSGPETSFDVFLPEFDDMVTRIEDLADSLALREALPLDDESTPFTMEMGILHPLFFIATKCRNWTVRRRAVSALKRGGREGIWEGPIVALIAERIMEIEEADVVPGDVIPEANRVHSIRKDVDYAGRQVLMEAKRSVDLEEWKVWEVIRESVKF